MQYKAKH